MRLLGLFTAAWMAIGAVAQASDAVVVELFTSQGCSSCPPADRILGELAERDDIIALAYHVDYWDYLGWKDEFADPKHTTRQRAYSRAAGERTIYTPQMVVGGVDHVVGSRAMKVSNAILKHARKDLPVSVTLKRHGDQVAIQAKAYGGASDLVVQLVTYRPEAKVSIKRGENRGRTLTYHNVVQSFTVLGNWNGQGAYQKSHKVPAGTPVVVLIQKRGAGPIVGASHLR